MTEGMGKPKAGRGTRRSGASKPAKAGAPVSESIDRRAAGPGDWREETLARVRALIREADPETTEERKWKKPSNAMAGVPVWSRHGIVCTGETYKQVVKLTFARGADLPDPAGLFNSSLEGNTRRAIDIREGEAVDPAAFRALVQAAVARNVAKTAKPGAGEAGPVKLLSGGNPQIAKGDGDAPVRAYIAAMPGWTRDLGERLDALVVRAVPGVRKAVKWNSPFYGVEGRGWFLSFHVFTRYVKVTFFNGTSLRPAPPGGTPKSKDVRWIDIREGDALDEVQMAAWVEKAAALPGWVP